MAHKIFVNRVPGSQSEGQTSVDSADTFCPEAEVEAIITRHELQPINSCLAQQKGLISLLKFYVHLFSSRDLQCMVYTVVFHNSFCNM